MDLEQGYQLDEQFYITEIDERYKQYAGISYDKPMMEQLVEMRTISARTFYRILFPANGVVSKCS
jgi:hypothetical protein